MNPQAICLGCMKEKGESPVCSHCGYDERSLPASPLFLKPGVILKGQYLVGKVLGSGGFGITYLGYDINLGLKLAIKEYFPTGLVTREPSASTVTVYSGDNADNFAFGLDKFLDEARTLAKFDDVPEIVSVKDFFKENGTAYLVMSYVEGITLKEYAAQHGVEGRLPIDAVLTFMLPVMKALSSVHAAGILHRDISPDNIYITSNYSVKLLDFGAARYAMGEHSRSLSVMLKPGFAPEEQYRSRGKQGPWTDVYAVAATFYRLLTGETPPDALDRMSEDELKPLSAFGIEVPDTIGAALHRAMSVKAAERYQTIDEFEKALTSGFAEETIRHESEPTVPAYDWGVPAPTLGTIGSNASYEAAHGPEHSSQNSTVVMDAPAIPQPLSETTQQPLPRDTSKSKALRNKIIGTAVISLAMLILYPSTNVTVFHNVLAAILIIAGGFLFGPISGGILGFAGILSSIMAMNKSITGSPLSFSSFGNLMMVYALMLAVFYPFVGIFVGELKNADLKKKRYYMLVSAAYFFTILLEFYIRSLNTTIGYYLSNVTMISSVLILIFAFATIFALYKLQRNQSKRPAQVILKDSILSIGAVLVSFTYPITEGLRFGGWFLVASELGAAIVSVILLIAFSAIYESVKGRNVK